MVEELKLMKISFVQSPTDAIERLVEMVNFILVSLKLLRQNWVIKLKSS